MMRRGLLVVAIASCNTTPPQPASTPKAIAVDTVDAAPTQRPEPVDAGDPDQNGCGEEKVDACVAWALKIRNGPGPAANRHDNEVALMLLETACAEDHPRGCEAVAEMLQDWQYYGGTRDDATACVLAWDKACRLRNLHACYRLGFYYTEWLTRDLAVDANGRVRKYRRKEDHARGIELMTQACKAGIVESCEHLKDALGP